MIYLSDTQKSNFSKTYFTRESSFRQDIKREDRKLAQMKHDLNDKYESVVKLHKESPNFKRAVLVNQPYILK